MAALTMEDMHKFDDVFLGILQRCGKIEPFLEAIFYFLARRTDFFRLMYMKDDKLGFPPGVAQKLVLKIFEKYQSIVSQNQQEKQQKIDSSILDVPPIINEVEVTSDEPQNNASSEVTEKRSNNCDKADNQKSVEADITNSPKKESSTSTDTSTTTDDCFNGGKNDQYSWSQSISDVDLKIPVPCYVKKAKDLSIVIKSEALCVELKQQPPADSGFPNKTLVNGTLTNRIICEESLWSLIPGDHIEVNLEKTQHKWWTAVLSGEEEIDRTKIDTTQHVHDFDESTQADIRKVMYDQQQKMMGKPTSEEQKTHNLLREAWDAEGSPFKGTPFDPSTVNMSGAS